MDSARLLHNQRSVKEVLKAGPMTVMLEYTLHFVSFCYMFHLSRQLQIHCP